MVIFEASWNSGNQGSILFSSWNLIKSLIFWADVIIGKKKINIKPYYIHHCDIVFVMNW